MGYRLSKIATRTGDDGTTGLGDGSRVRKNDERVAAMGEVDELNSQLGVLLAEPLPDGVRDVLIAIQHDLFDLGGQLCIPGRTVIGEAHLARLDDWLALYNETLPPLTEFILPGGTRAAALAHVCRTVCRRAERALVTLALHTSPAAARADAPPEQAPGRYLNRLSDLLFVLARVLNRAAQVPDVLWQPRREQG
jgi:cob(I)alamin adenosyltransferase